MMKLEALTPDVTLEIEASIPSGVPDHVIRVVTENSRTLKLDHHGFEREQGLLRHARAHVS